MGFKVALITGGVDISNYADLCGVFRNVFEADKQLDFAFANAGTIERSNFYEIHGDGSAPPPLPDLATIDINLRGTIYTTNLAIHYFRLSPHKGAGANLVMTSSAAGIYPMYYSPVYSAPKHGIVGFTRSIAPILHKDGIRTNVLLPGLVRSNILEEAAWAAFPAEAVTPAKLMADAVLQVIGGGDMTDARGVTIAGPKLYGRSVEVAVDRFYFREQPEYCDDKMRALIESTGDDAQLGTLVSE
ncbi:15-hydroxyprostaglandin dehydrogenase (NAD(+)) [Lasiodiplodia theobromae]|uniref:15-hydroxyprostaglandin dehydrogenase (NAD(+)) n=1 Tax=Lasiodiplodia theobromae TaxID=45133 RepID=A0A5N5D3P4_9PEZI|nr:15-hydroxyprostaglandin dehydrogenase (NAD(+)) [Lasiodiplodia theobromae]